MGRITWQLGLVAIILVYVKLKEQKKVLHLSIANAKFKGIIGAIVWRHLDQGKVLRIYYHTEQYC